MDRQAGFLLALLFLANFLTIEAENSGQQMLVIKVNAGTPWSITCRGLQGTEKVVGWTRDGNPIESEIKSGELLVTNTTDTATISATSAKESHEGEYKCTPDAIDVYFLRVQIDSTPALSRAVSSVSSDATNSLAASSIFALEVNSTLQCNGSSNATTLWKKNNETLPPNNEHYEIRNGGIFFKKAVSTSLGNYSCSQPGSSEINYQVIVKPAVVLAPNSSVVEGERFRLVCELAESPYTPAFLGAVVTWNFNGSNYTESRERVRLNRDDTHGLDNAELVIENMNMTEHSKYSGPIHCMVKYTRLLGEPDSEGITYLVVKDKLAALWPFLGICLEVVVLCAIILVYEKKRNKAELEESDTDQSPDTKPTPNKDSEVRHRK